MTTQYDDETDEQDSNLVKSLREQLKDKESKLKELELLKAENSKLKSTNTIREAGLNLNERQVKALLATHEGDLTAESIKTTAEELGFIEAQTRPDVADVQAEAQMDAVRKGSGEASTARTYQEELAAARTREEANAVIRKYGGEVVTG